MAASTDNSTPAASLDYSNLSSFTLPGGVVFYPTGYSGISGGGGGAVNGANITAQTVPMSALVFGAVGPNQLAHGDYIDTSASAGTKVGQLTAGSLVSNGAIGAAGAITGASLASSGVITATGKISAGAGGGVNAQWFNAMDFGAVVNGVTDDSAALIAAIAAALAAGGGVVHVPRGATANCGIAAKISLPATVSFYAPNITFRAVSGYTGDCFSFDVPAQYGYWGERYTFGSITGFTSGCGIVFRDGTSGAVVSVVNISQCAYHIAFIATTGAIFNHTVRFQQLALSTGVGVYYFCGNSATLQGCEVRGATIIGLGVGIQFAGSTIAAGGYQLGANVVDVGCVNGNVANTTGILYSNCSPAANNFITVRNSFGSFSSGRYLVCQNANPQNQLWELALSEQAGLVTTTAASFTQPAIGANVTMSTAVALTTGLLYFVGNGSTTGADYTCVSGGSSPVMRCDVAAISGVGATVASGAQVTSGIGGQYADFSFGAAGQGNNILRIIGGVATAAGYLGLVPGYTANTLGNSRSSFNGGIPQFFQRFLVQCTFPFTAQGNQASFYCYSPFTQGAGLITATMVTLSAFNAGAPVLVMALDTSTTHPNEISLSFIAATAITAGLIAYVVVSVGG